MTKSPSDSEVVGYVRRHLQFGWWSLLCFLTLGMALEALHGFKIGWYLEADFEIRRLMWRLGHSHGALLGVVHIVFAATLSMLPGEMARHRRFASALLMGASILLPGGFFLGGIWIYDGDPGLGIVLVPFGALALFFAVLLTALSVTSSNGAKSK